MGFSFRPAGLKLNPVVSRDKSLTFTYYVSLLLLVAFPQMFSLHKSDLCVLIVTLSTQTLINNTNKQWTIICFDAYKLLSLVLIANKSWQLKRLGGACMNCAKHVSPRQLSIFIILYSFIHCVTEYSSKIDGTLTHETKAPKAFFNAKYIL